MNPRYSERKAVVSPLQPALTSSLSLQLLYFKQVQRWWQQTRIDRALYSYFPWKTNTEIHRLVQSIQTCIWGTPTSVVLYCIQLKIVTFFPVVDKKILYKKILYITLQTWLLLHFQTSIFLSVRFKMTQLKKKMYTICCSNRTIYGIKKYRGGSPRSNISITKQGHIIQLLYVT